MDTVLTGMFWQGYFSSFSLIASMVCLLFGFRANTHSKCELNIFIFFIFYIQLFVCHLCMCNRQLLPNLPATYLEKTAISCIGEVTWWWSSYWTVLAAANSPHCVNKMPGRHRYQLSSFSNGPFSKPLSWSVHDQADMIRPCWLCNYGTDRHLGASTGSSLRTRVM